MIDTLRLSASALAAAIGLASSVAPVEPLVAQEVQQNEDASATFLKLADRHAAEILRVSPEFATQLGVGEEIAGPGYGARLTDFSPSGQRDVAALIERLRRELGSVDRRLLRGTAAITYDVMAAAYDLASRQNALGTGPASALGVLQPYATDQLFGPHVTLPRLFAAQMPIRNAAELATYLDRLENLDDAFLDVSEQLREDAERNAAPPRFVLEKVAEASREFAALSLEENPIFQSATAKIDALEDLTPQEWATAKKRLSSVLMSQVAPAMLDYAETASELAKDASDDAGVWRIKNGAGLYQIALDNYGADGLSADEIHTIGLDEVVRIHAEMDAILRAEGYDEGSVGDRMRQLAANPDFQYDNTESGKAQVLAILDGYVREAAERSVPAWFTSLPPQRIEVRRIPPLEENSASGGYYTPPTLDGSQPGIFWINLKDMRDWPAYTLKSLVYHEAIPGHHFQASTAQAIDAMPLIRNMVWFVDYGEGWALYTEALAVEMGLYEGDDLGNLGRLRMELYRAARLVVDTGLHHKRWSRGQAVDWMTDVTGESRESIIREIDRYAVWPGQATSYKIGMIKFQELRARAEKRLGERFNIRAYHDFVLSTGAVPMGVLSRLLDEWIDKQERP